MVAFYSNLAPTRIFVPLCGKSHDLIWFMSQGHEVIGVELSELDCEECFLENKIPFQKRVQKGATVYQAPQITLFNQDFFSLTSEDLGKICGVYDRAALIALPSEVRSRYAAHMISLLRKCCDASLSYCQMVLERMPAYLGGPPFSISEKELNELFGGAFKIGLISREIESEECVNRLIFK